MNTAILWWVAGALLWTILVCFTAYFYGHFNGRQMGRDLGISQTYAEMMHVFFKRLREWEKDETQETYYDPGTVFFEEYLKYNPVEE